MLSKGSKGVIDATRVGSPTEAVFILVSCGKYDIVPLN